MDEFHFELTDEEKTYLKDLVSASIKSRFGGGADVSPPKPPTDKLGRELGAFVTLKVRGRLRGCIGHVVGNEPVYETVWKMARSAAFNDPRFPPLSEEEFAQAEVEISILSPLEPCPDLTKVEPGKHGLMVNKGMASGLLLPQVAVEWGWDRENFLSHTCQKAGLPMNCWQDESTTVYWFQAEVF